MLNNYTNKNYVMLSLLCGILNKTHFSCVDWQSGIVMFTAASYIELCSGGMERGTLRCKNQRLRTTRSLDVISPIRCDINDSTVNV